MDANQINALKMKIKRCVLVTNQSALELENRKGLSVNAGRPFFFEGVHPAFPPTEWDRLRGLLSDLSSQNNGQKICTFLYTPSGPFLQITAKGLTDLIKKLWKAPLVFIHRNGISAGIVTRTWVRDS